MVSSKGKIQVRWLRWRLWCAVVCLGLYLLVLLSPGVMGGSVTDKSGDSFSGRMGSAGGWLMYKRAGQTLAMAHLVPGATVCEIGPGRGVVGEIAVGLGYGYIAIDGDVGVAARLPAGSRFYCGWVPPMPADLPKVDCIVVENVMEHLASYGAAVEFIAACRDALEPGGRLVIRSPEIRYSGWRFWETADHQWPTSLARMSVILRGAGLAVEDRGLAMDCLTGWKMSLVWWVKRCFPWQAVHQCLYEPWQSSPWSRIAEKAPHFYVVAVK